MLQHGNRTHLLAMVGLALLVVIVTLPRFNQKDLGFQRLTNGSGLVFSADDGVNYENLPLDVHQYLLLVKHLRYPGSVNPELVLPPFTYRPLSPLLASYLPWNEMTSLNLVNVLSLVLSVFVLASIMARMNLTSHACWLSLLIFVVSFPVFYYGSIGYLDPLLILMLAIGLLITTREVWLLFPLLIFIGVFAKEGVAILLPIPFVAALQRRPLQWTTLISGIVAVLAYVIATLVARSLIAHSEQYLWVPGFSMAMSNLTRFRALFSIGVSFAIPGILSLILIYRMLITKTIPNFAYVGHLITGFAFSLLYCGYGVSSVRADGRYIWPMYVFSVPMMAVLFSHERGLLRWGKAGTTGRDK